MTAGSYRGHDQRDQRNQRPLNALEGLRSSPAAATTAVINGDAHSHSGDGSGGSGGGSCVHQLFEEQAAQRPEALCFIGGEQRLSYGVVNAAANQLAHRLADAGVTADVAVGVSLPRCPSLVIALLAVLKAGGCYVPLDAGLPRARAAFMLKQAGAHLLLVEQDSSLSGLPSVQTLHVGNPEGSDWQCGSLSASNLPPRCTAADLYSITYTRFAYTVCM